MAKGMYIGAPSIYQKVEYIESTGTQYINTGVSENSIYGMEFVFEINKIGVSYQSLVAGTLDVFTLGSRNETTGLYLRLKSAEIFNKTGIVVSGKNVLSVRNGVVVLNGTQIGTYTDGAFSNNTGPVYVFTNSGVTRISTMRVYGLKFFNSSGELIRNFVPCYRKSDNVTGLYDSVTNSLYADPFKTKFLLGSDIESTGVAKKVGKGYIGIDNVTRKIKKGYVGDENGIARLFYSAETIVNFNACPFPTSWTQVINMKEYTATNEYGTWSVYATGTSEYLSEPYKAFDRNSSTLWRWGTIGQTLQIDCPIAIKPSRVYILCYNIASTSFEGYNIQTGEWESICTLTMSGSDSTTNENVEVDGF